MATEYTGEIIPQEYTGEVIPFEKTAKPAADEKAMPEFDPTSGMSDYEKFTAGMGKAMVDIGRGVGQRLGIVSQEDVEQARRLDEPLMRTGAGQAGTIAGGLAVGAPAMLIPGAGTVPGAMALGAAFGTAQPTTKEESVAGNIGTGAAFGLGGALAPRAIARTVSPKAVERAKASLGELTPGQTLGGFFKTAEEKATSLPLAGPAIAKAQRESIESFNKGVLNKVLEPIGQTTAKVGHEGVEEASRKLSLSYEKLLPKLNIQVDDAFDLEMKELRKMASNMAEPQAKQFEQILGAEGLGRKITSYGKMTGESMKEIDRELGRLSRGYAKSEDFDKQQLGDALREAQASLRALVERSNPQHADELKNINRGWARLVRVENAAAKTGAKDGIFTPAQLNQAVRATDKSLRHRQFAHGKALFQDIATQAEKTIGNVYPDPGTAGRVLLAGGAGAGYALKPELLLGEGTLAGIYGVPPIRRALASAFTKRPKGAAKLAEKIRATSPTAGRVGAVAGEGYLAQDE